QAGADDWCVAVIDDGPGIPAESLDRVFEPFFRLSRDEHSRIEGNGLGLSICRELTEQLRGTIVLDSTPGAGPPRPRLQRPPAGLPRPGCGGETEDTDDVRPAHGAARKLAGCPFFWSGP